MKIGILTYHCVTNFGAQLQTLSTIGYMKKHGHEPIVLNWFPQDLEDFYLKFHPKNQFDEQFDFSQKEMPVSRLCRTLPELCEEIDRQQLDAIFIGSDALFDYCPQRVLNPFSLRKLKRVKNSTTSNHLLPNPFWGSFNDMINRKVPYCGFSISSQNAPYYRLTSKELKEMKKLLDGFTLITTRDEWTRKMVQYISGRTDTFITPDPVFSFNQNFDAPLQKETLLQKYGLPQDYILISFYGNQLSEEYVNQIVKLVEERTGVSCVSFPMPRRLREFKTKYKIDLPLPTLDWYYLIKYSKGYIGELMHPIIVSLHNNVPFFCFDQYGITKTIIRGVWYKYIKESSKIYDILQRADLLSNQCPYYYSKNLRPEDVVDRFLAFDKEKCDRFSHIQRQRYSEGMDKVISSLIL